MVVEALDPKLIDLLSPTDIIMMFEERFDIMVLTMTVLYKILIIMIKTCSSEIP